MSGGVPASSRFALRGHAKIEDWEIEDPYGDSEKYQGPLKAFAIRCELAGRLRKQFAAEGGSVNIAVVLLEADRGDYFAAEPAFAGRFLSKAFWEMSGKTKPRSAPVWPKNLNVTTPAVHRRP